MLTIENVTKSFQARAGRGKPAEPLVVLDDVSLTVAAGEFVTIVGPSGCGKSTLLNCIAGLEQVDTGEIRVDATPVDGPSHSTAVVFQKPSLLPWRTVRKNVEYGLEIRRFGTAHERADAAHEGLALVGLQQFADYYPHQLSGGMQQRANLARALVTRPRLLLMDEPFGALDALTRQTMQDELNRLAVGTDRTTVFITHDAEEAVYLGDRVVVMSPQPGQIREIVNIELPRPRSRTDMAGSRMSTLVLDLQALLLNKERVSRA